MGPRYPKGYPGHRAVLRWHLNVLSCVRLRSCSVSLHCAHWPNAHDTRRGQLGCLDERSTIRLRLFPPWRTFQIGNFP